MAKRDAKAAEVIDVGPVLSEDEALTTTDGRAIAGWVQGLRQFFGTALELEQAAQSTLAEARTLQAPKDAAGDVAVQKFIKRTTEDRKTLEAHWGITAVIHRFHRRLTSKRDIGAKALEEANTIGNRLHSTYVEAEKRRAQEQERREREEREFLARQEREAELAQLEAAAVAAEESSPDLSEREGMFVDLFCSSNSLYTGRGQACAVAAGYKDAIATSGRLLSSAKIQLAIKAKQQAATIRRQVTAKAAAPVVVEHVEVRPAIERAAGMSDRTTWGGEVLDERSLMTAFLGCAPEDYKNRFGIPADLFMVNPVKLAEYGRSLHERLDGWPGVRHTKKTRAV
jgi:hypothetical protein